MDLNEILLAKNGFLVDEDVISTLVIGDDSEMKEPLISIVIPTFKRPKLLRKSIESALLQNVDVPFEVVVVDNNSDSTENYLVNECISSFKSNNLKLYRNERNVGLYGNWNRCLQLAQGKWISLLNDDDLLDADFLSTCLDEINNNREISGICCKTRLLNDNNKESDIPFYRRLVKIIRTFIDRDKTGIVTKLRPVDYFISSPHCGTLGVLMDRQKAIGMGGFYAGYYPVSDYIFFSRFSLEYGMYCLNEKHVSYRIHENENIKTDTIIESIRLGYRVRQSLAKYTKLPLLITDYYSRLYAINTPKSLSLLLGAKCDVNNVLEKAGFKNRPVYFQLSVTYVLIKFILSPILK